jgi:hypothetical protein
MKSAVLALMATGLASTSILSQSQAAETDAATSAGCARSFDAAQRTDMESFRDFDVETFREVHASDAISIFPSGDMYEGIDAIMDGLARHFREQDAVWSWTELSRNVNGCKSAVIVYETTYDIPAFGYHQRALTVVTYTFKGGEWHAVMDQGTPLESS